MSKQSVFNFVFSNPLNTVGWNKTKIVRGDIIEEVKKMKQQPGNPMTLLGSGNILARFSEHGLIDEYQFVVDPVAIGDGTPIQKGIGRELGLELTGTEHLRAGPFCFAASL